MADSQVSSSAPTIGAEPLAVLSLTVNNIVVGPTPHGFRLEVPFEGTATSPSWEGEWRVTGVDHVITGSDRIAQLDVHGVITNGTESIMYHASGRADRDGVREIMTFSTGSEQHAWMNGITAVGRGVMDGTSLNIEVFQINY